MIVICEECGKKYRIDPAKMRGSAASFQCRVCTHRILVGNPQPASAAPGADAGDRQDQPADSGRFFTPPDQPAAAPPSFSPTARPVRRNGRLGIRARMMLLFALIPLLLISGASVALLWQMETLSRELTRQGSRIVNQLAEEKIADLSVAVAMQCRLYLTAHPELSKYQFAADVGFKAIAVQPVGKTGYTALYELPGPDNVWRTWAHVNPGIVGIDMAGLKETLGPNFPGFWKIFSGIKDRQESRGYYAWRDEDGGLREKFMVCTPVPGTPYVIAATTYLDEFTLPMREVEINAQALNAKSRRVAVVVIVTTLLLILLTVVVYGHRLSGRIRSLTDVADRISIGELDIEIEARSGDEIDDLAAAIARMQESIRLSIERLRRRR